MREFTEFTEFTCTGIHGIRAYREFTEFAKFTYKEIRGIHGMGGRGGCKNREESSNTQSSRGGGRMIEHSHNLSSMLRRPAGSMLEQNIYKANKKKQKMLENNILRRQ